MIRYLLPATLFLVFSCTKTGPEGSMGVPVLLQGAQDNANEETEYLTRYHDCAFPAVTASLLNSGVVLAFAGLNSDKWTPMPYETNIGVVRLHFFTNPDGTTLSIFDMPTRTYKLVALSGTAVNALKRAHVNLGDYAAVSRFMGSD